MLLTVIVLKYIYFFTDFLMKRKIFFYRKISHKEQRKELRMSKKRK